MTRRTIAGSLLLASVAALALSGCSTIENILAGPQAQVFEVGECLDSDSVVSEEEYEVGEMPVVDCTEVHDAEVFAVADTTSAEFDATSLGEETDALCANSFEAYVGAPYETSSIYYSLLYPTADSWETGDRQLVCLLTVQEDVSESFAGSGL